MSFKHDENCDNAYLIGEVCSCVERAIAAALHRGRIQGYLLCDFNRVDREARHATDYVALLEHKDAEFAVMSAERDGWWAEMEYKP